MARRIERWWEGADVGTRTALWRYLAARCEAMPVSGYRPPTGVLVQARFPKVAKAIADSVETAAAGRPPRRRR